MARKVDVLGTDDDGYQIERVELADGWVLRSLPCAESYAFVQEVREVEVPAYREDPDPLADLHWEDVDEAPTYH